MATVHRAFGCRFVIFTNDHDPAHVHVFGQGAEAKLSLDPVALISSAGFKKPDLKRILKEVQDQRDLLLKKWNEIHGKR